jgi:hypothetical protein
MQEKQSPSVRMLALATGTIGGFLVAFSAQILLGHMNVEVEAAWRNLFVTSTAQIKSALAWWLIAGAALAGGFLAAATARFLMLNWWPLRGLRWVLGAAVVAALAAVGHVASEVSTLDGAAHVAGNVAGMSVSLVTACLGAFFAARR